jgi:hypothetical protein
MEEEVAVVATVDLRVSLEVTVEPVAAGLLVVGMELVALGAGAESSRAVEPVPGRRTGNRVTKRIVLVVEVGRGPQQPIGTQARSGRRVVVVDLARPFSSIKLQAFLLVVVEVVLEVVPLPAMSAQPADSAVRQ